MREDAIFLSFHGASERARMIHHDLRLSCSDHLARALKPQRSPEVDDLIVHRDLVISDTFERIQFRYLLIVIAAHGAKSFDSLGHGSARRVEWTEERRIARQRIPARGGFDINEGRQQLLLLEQ